MTTKAELQLRLDALRKARDSGILTIRHGETSTTFRSLDDISRVIRELEGEISGKTATRIRYPYQRDKGL